MVIDFFQVRLKFLEGPYLGSGITCFVFEYFVNLDSNVHATLSVPTSTLVLSIRYRTSFSLSTLFYHAKSRRQGDRVTRVPRMNYTTIVYFHRNCSLFYAKQSNDGLFLIF